MNNTKPEKKEIILSIVFALLGNTFWGFSYLFTRVALRSTDPETLLSHRFFLATLLLSIPLLMRKQKLSLKGKTVTPIILLCIFEPLCFITESYGILHTNSTFAGVMLSIVPIVTILTGFLFLHEVPSKRQILWGILPVIGVIFIVTSGNQLGVVTPIGLLFLLISCLASAGYKTSNRKASQEFTPFERSYFVLLNCAIVFTVWSLIRCGGKLSVYFQPFKTSSYILALLGLSLFCSVVAGLCINYAAARIPVFRLSVFGAVSTICTIIGGFFFLHEPVTAAMLIGAAMIIIGITMLNRTKA